MLLFLFASLSCGYVMFQKSIVVNQNGGGGHKQCSTVKTLFWSSLKFGVKYVPKEENVEFFLDLGHNFHQFAAPFRMRLVTAAKASPCMFYSLNAGHKHPLGEQNPPGPPQQWHCFVVVLGLAKTKFFREFRSQSSFPIIFSFSEESSFPKKYRETQFILSTVILYHCCMQVLF